MSWKWSGYQKLADCEEMEEKGKSRILIIPSYHFPHLLENLINLFVKAAKSERFAAAKIAESILLPVGTHHNIGTIKIIYRYIQYTL